MADEKQSDKARREDLPKKEESSTGSGIDQNTTASASAPASTPGAFISAATSPYVNMQKALEAMFPYYREIIEPSLTAEDLTDNPLNIYNSNMRRNITSKYYNLQIPVYGFTVSEPKLLSLEECNTYSHYLPMYNYFALNGIQVPDKVYASNVRIPIMSDGGFATAPEVFDKKQKIQAANFINPLCFADGLYLADYTVIPKDRLVKVVFTDKNYQHGRIIGVGEYPNLLAESIQKYYPNLQIPFQGLLGIMSGIGGNPLRMVCSSNEKFTYKEFPELKAICLEEGSLCVDQARNAVIIYNKVKEHVTGYDLNKFAAAAIINSFGESSLYSGADSNKTAGWNNNGRPEDSLGLFQLNFERGEGVPFLRDSRIQTLLGRAPQRQDALNAEINADYSVRKMFSYLSSGKSPVPYSADGITLVKEICIRFERPANKEFRAQERAATYAKYIKC